MASLVAAAAPPARADEARAPRYALVLGARAGYLAFGGRFYQAPNQVVDTTGQWAKDGVAGEIDVGARLGRRFVPYLAGEHVLLARGHHFTGTDAAVSATYLAGGLRYLVGDVDGVSPVVDLGLGKRFVSAEDDGQRFTMSGVELRFAAGAELRLANAATASALAGLGIGSLGDTDGTVRFAAGTPATPPYANGARIALPQTYIAFTVGVGVHFDLFGRR